MKKYFLFSKTETENNNCAKLIRDCTLTSEKFEKHCNNQYEKMFQKLDDNTGGVIALYNSEIHFVYYGYPLKFPKWDGEEIREKTEIEAKQDGNITLSDGEYIENNNVVVKSKPTELHVWEIKTNSWQLDSDLLNLEKEKMKEQITDYRDNIRETDTVSYNGHAQRYRKSDLSDIDYYQKRLEKAQEKAQEAENKKATEENREPEKVILLMNWYFYDGSTMQLSVENFDEILALTDTPIEDLYRKEAVLKAMIENMTIAEELENFDIETTWNNA